MSDIIQALIKRSSVFIIITGVLLLVIGASGKIVFNTFSFQFSSPTTQWVIIVTSLILLIVGIYQEIKINSVNQNAPSKNFGLFTLDTNPLVHAKVEDLIESAKTIDILGYNSKSVLQEFRSHLANAIVRGASVRVIFTDISQYPTKEIFERHAGHSAASLPSEWAKALGYINDIQKILKASPKVNGKLEIKSTTWIPSCNLILFNSADNKNGIARIDFHALSFRQPLTLAGKLFLVISQKDNLKAFEYFAKGFDLLWEKESQEWNGIDSSINQVSEK